MTRLHAALLALLLGGVAAACGGSGSGTGGGGVQVVGPGNVVTDPAEHKWRRVSNDDLGEDGCKHYHSTPRLGLVGMLMGWWRVKISSGCP